ncbi:carbohydrate ABC transporter permease [Ruthenibacterium lactatiformans]|jgi:putative aldouronate transport system permease protein|uniref:carbohydrate ABC transporter permease n=1 Tax=Ruthenibacterium lactatiformans TaxID=1550024 RepID=UPI000E764616|nr:carbohydrate ABC transporter permease [Ruthenibacterium lactatiformans]RJW26993.1 carbohydrate ABC transporter permease [Subdoligranulum sp. TF05-17AC]
MLTNNKHEKLFRVCLHLFFIALSALFIIPMLSVIFIAFTSESSISTQGYPFFFREINLNAFQYILDNPKTIVDAYKVTIFTSFGGTFLYLLLSTMAAYAISRPGFTLKKPLTFFFFFTMLFNGGLVPTYILMSQTLHLKNTYLALIVPLLVNVWYLIMLKTFMSEIPNEILESAKIDGAGHFTIYTRFILPLSKPALATIGLLTLLDYWNSWQPAMLYIDEKEMYPLQYMLQVMLRNIMEILKEMQNNISIGNIQDMPSESARMAMCILAVGPMLFIFPFFQKYFTRGLTVGAVKG